MTQSPLSSSPQRLSRRRITIVGAIVTSILVLSYIAIAVAYGRSMSTTFSAPSPATDEIAIVVALEEIQPVAGQLKASLLLFPGSSFVDSDGRLIDAVVVTAYPSSQSAEIVFPAGRVPAPKPVVLPIAGTVQQYPFDSWEMRTNYRTLIRGADGDQDAPLAVSSFIRTPGWTFDLQALRISGNADTLEGRFSRDFSTIGIALLFLSLMMIIAALVVRVVQSVARGRLELNLFVASWITALLFALVPLRGALPGAPPLGSWIDILVYFWVVAIVMVSLALVTSLLLARARRDSEAASVEELTEERI